MKSSGDQINIKFPICLLYYFDWKCATHTLGVFLMQRRRQTIGTIQSLAIFATVATFSAGFEATVTSMKPNIVRVIKNNVQNKKLKRTNYC